MLYSRSNIQYILSKSNLIIFALGHRCLEFSCMAVLLLFIQPNSKILSFASILCSVWTPFLELVVFCCFLLITVNMVSITFTFRPDLLPHSVPCILAPHNVVSSVGQLLLTSTLEVMSSFELLNGSLKPNTGAKMALQSSTS